MFAENGLVSNSFSRIHDRGVKFSGWGAGAVYMFQASFKFTNLNNGHAGDAMIAMFGAGAQRSSNNSVPSSPASH